MYSREDDAVQHKRVMRPEHFSSYEICKVFKEDVDKDPILAFDFHESGDFAVSTKEQNTFSLIDVTTGVYV